LLAVLVVVAAAAVAVELVGCAQQLLQRVEVAV
jgi:hypothetical protein